MHILLIKPPNRGFGHQMERHMPVGPAYLAAVLERAGHRTTIFDGLAFDEDNHVIEEIVSPVEAEKVARHPKKESLVHWGASWDRISRAIAEAKPDVVGISSMFSCYHLSANKVARLAKEIFPDVPVVIGGPHPTSMPARALEERCIDAAALGEAEDTVVALMERMQRRDNLTDLAGVAFRCGEGRCDCAEPVAGGVHIQPKVGFREDLDALPYPKIDGLMMDRYGHTTTLITSRGCPFSCSFCSVHATVGKKFRARDPKKVVDEVAWYVSQGIRKFGIEDDNFTFDIDRVVRFCEEVRARGIDAEFYLPNGITSVKLTDELTTTLIGAGFRGLFIGLESTEPEILKSIAKGFTSLEAVVTSATNFGKHGLSPAGSLIIGLPGQSVRQVAVDVTNLLSHGIPTTCNPFYPVPGAPDYARARSQGLLGADTDPAILESMACSDTFEIDSEAVYWTVAAVTALNLAYPFIVECRRAHLDGQTSEPLELLRAVLQETDTRVTDDGRILIPAHECYCGGQRITRKASSARLCNRIGDMGAMVVSLIQGEALSMDETECRVHTGGDACTFQLVPKSPSEPQARVVTTFVSALDEVLDGPRPFPERRKKRLAAVTA